MEKKKLLWSVERMTAAINKVLAREMTIREAADAFGIPKSTLHDKTVSLKSGKETLLEPKLGRFASTFSYAYEEELAFGRMHTNKNGIWRVDVSH